MKRFKTTELIIGDEYILRTNENDPPIRCTLIELEPHRSGGKLPIFKNIEGGKSETLMFIGPTLKFDQAIYDKLKTMGGREGYDWLVANSE